MNEILRKVLCESELNKKLERSIARNNFYNNGTDYEKTGYKSYEHADLVQAGMKKQRDQLSNLYGGAKTQGEAMKFKQSQTKEDQEKINKAARELLSKSKTMAEAQIIVNATKHESVEKINAALAPLTESENLDESTYLNVKYNQFVNEILEEDYDKIITDYSSKFIGKQTVSLKEMEILENVLSECLGYNLEEAENNFVLEECDGEYHVVLDRAGNLRKVTDLTKLKAVAAEYKKTVKDEFAACKCEKLTESLEKLALIRDLLK